jgi:TPR repeat protein
MATDFLEPETTWEQAERAARDGNHRELLLLLCRLHKLGQWRVTAQIGAMYELGGQGVEIDEEAAAHWYRRAVFESDDPVAHLGLGRLYFRGWSKCAVDLAQARQHLNSAIRKGRPEAGIHLGLMFMHGHGVEKNSEAADSAFLDAARATFPVAYYYLAQSSLLQKKRARAAYFWIRWIIGHIRLWLIDSKHPNLWKP